MTTPARSYNGSWLAPLLVLVESCTAIPTVAPPSLVTRANVAAPTNVFPVQWLSGFKMARQLTNPVDLRGKADLRTFLSTPWFAEAEVSPTRAGSAPQVLSSCNQYFEQTIETTWTTRDYEMQRFRVNALLCEATQALLAAQAASHSLVEAYSLSIETPTHFPKAVALVISSSRQKEINSSATLKTWADVTQELTIEQLDGGGIAFTALGGRQEIEIVGKGDFDGNGWQDLLISSRDSVTGGSYKNYRLFALSRLIENGSFLLIKEYRLGT